MNVTEHEMRGLLAGKCLPGDMRVNEDLPAYLVRKFAELKAQRDALAVEREKFAVQCAAAKIAVQYAKSEGFECALNTPDIDAFLHSVRAEGINFAANRMLAAWESGFIDDTPAQVHDISGAVLSALEFLTNASPEEFKRDYADEVRSAIAAQLSASNVGKGALMMKSGELVKASEEESRQVREFMRIVETPVDQLGSGNAGKDGSHG